MEIILEQKQRAPSRSSQAATQILNDPGKVQRICVLQCGTSWLHNYTGSLAEPGRQLALRREPDNPYDRWATLVCTPEGTVLGYLPARKNQSVARLMDAGKTVTVFVDADPPEHQPPENPLLPLAVYVDVTIREGGTP